jgi:SAM-dependent methyltransferase
MPPPFLTRVAESARTEGALPTAAALAGWGGCYLAGLPSVWRSSDKAFELDGEPVPYLRHRYNRTWLNERAVEVPLALRVLEKRRGGEILEVGNVLGHYGARGHTVVDRYERAPNVLNEDVTDFDPGDRRFDLIVSVSTLEHVGFDEQPLDPDKPLRAMRALATMLAPGGLLWSTLPVGYNPALDAHARAGALPFDRVSALRRAGRGLDWRQVDPQAALDSPYDHLLCAASAVLIGRLERR